MNTCNLLSLVSLIVFFTLQFSEPTLSLGTANQKIAVALSPESVYHNNEIVESKDNLLFIALISGPSSFELRQKVRTSWLRAPFENKLRGAANGNEFGEGLTHKKTFRFGDIVFLPMIDAYRNLTLKTRLTFEHASAHYNFTFLGKVDDDVLLCKESIENFLSIFDRNVSLYFGIMVEPKVIREPNHKWYVSFEEYAEPSYPLYAVGPYYFLSKDLVTYLGAEKPVPKVSMEDVSVGVSLKNRGVPIVRASWLDPEGVSNEIGADKCLEGNGLKIFGTHGGQDWEKWQVCCDKNNPPENLVRIDSFDSKKN